MKRLDRILDYICFCTALFGLLGGAIVKIMSAKYGEPFSERLAAEISWGALLGLFALLFVQKILSFFSGVKK